MFFLALVTLGTVILELNPQKKLEGTGRRPTDTRDDGSNTQKETVYLLFCWYTWVRYLEYACLDKASSIFQCHIGPSITKTTVLQNPYCFTFGQAPHCSASSLIKWGHSPADSQGLTIRFPTNVNILATWCSKIWYNDVQMNCRRLD
jgi:hypothetical protein